MPKPSCKVATKDSTNRLEASRAIGMAIFCNHLYASQTKILQRVTKDDMRVFEVLFKAVSTGFGLRKSAFHLLFSLAKSSFGDHDLAKLKYDINFRAEKTRSLTLGIC